MWNYGTWVYRSAGISFLAHLRWLCGGAVPFGCPSPAEPYSWCGIPRCSCSPGLCGCHSQCFVTSDPLCSRSLTIPLLSRIRFEFSPVKSQGPSAQALCVQQVTRNCWASSAPLPSQRWAGRSLSWATLLWPCPVLVGTFHIWQSFSFSKIPLELLSPAVSLQQLFLIGCHRKRGESKLDISFFVLNFLMQEQTVKPFYEGIYIRRL